MVSTMAFHVFRSRVAPSHHRGCVYDFKSVQNATVIGLLGTARDQSAFSAIDRADMTVWLGQDGFVHKYSLDYEGHKAEDPNDKGALKMNVHLWDFGNPAITVTAPQDSKPMPE